MPLPPRWWSCRRRPRRSTPRRGWTCRARSRPCRGPSVWGSASDPLVGKRFGQFVEAAEIDTVRYLRQLEPCHVELVELLGALRAGLDARRMLDCLGQQTGEVAVGQRYSHA